MVLKNIYQFIVSCVLYFVSVDVVPTLKLQYRESKIRNRMHPEAHYLMMLLRIALRQFFAYSFSVTMMRAAVYEYKQKWWWNVCTNYWISFNRNRVYSNSGMIQWFEEHYSNVCNLFSFGCWDALHHPHIRCSMSNHLFKSAVSGIGVVYTSMSTHSVLSIQSHSDHNLCHLSASNVILSCTRCVFFLNNLLQWQLAIYISFTALIEISQKKRFI